MSIEVRLEGGNAQVMLGGELTIYTVAELKAGLAGAMDLADAIEVDLAGISDVDTAGLQWLLIAKRHPGKTVRFVNHPPAVVRLVDLANLGSVLGDPLVFSAREAGEGKP